MADYLAARVPSLDGDSLLREPLSPVRQFVKHGELQILVLAAQQVGPHLAREGLEDATFADLVDWIAPHLSERPADSQGQRTVRGSYETINVSLAPLTDGDLGALYAAAINPRVSHRWRFRGRTPSPEEFRATLYKGSLAQFMIKARSVGGEPIGLVSAYDADMISGHCYAAVQRTPHGTSNEAVGHGLMIEGVLTFVQYLFDHFSLRKIYFEIPEYNRDFLNSDGGLLEQEGRLIEHQYYADRYWDLYTYALYRSKWEEIAPLFRGDWPAGDPRQVTNDRV